MKIPYSNLLRMCVLLFGAVLFASPMRAQLITDSFKGSEVVANEVLVKFQAPAGDGLAQANVAARIEQAKEICDIDSSRGGGGESGTP